MSDLVMRRTIKASPEIVFGFLTEPSKLLEWLGMSGEVTAEVGGSLLLNTTGSDTMSGRYLEITPHSRVAFSWGWAGQTEVPPGSTTVTFDLTPTADGTALTMTHSGLPGGESDDHAAGWTYFLGRLRSAATGTSAGPVSLEQLGSTIAVLQED